MPISPAWSVATALAQTPADVAARRARKAIPTSTAARARCPFALAMSSQTAIAITLHGGQLR